MSSRVSLQKARNRLLSRCVSEIQNKPKTQKTSERKQEGQSPHPKTKGERGREREERERERGRGKEGERGRRREREVLRDASCPRSLLLPVLSLRCAAWPGGAGREQGPDWDPCSWRGFGFWLGSGWEKGHACIWGVGSGGSCLQGPRPAGGGVEGGAGVAGGCGASFLSGPRLRPAGRAGPTPGWGGGPKATAADCEALLRSLIWYRGQGVLLARLWGCLRLARRTLLSCARSLGDRRWQGTLEVRLRTVQGRGQGGGWIQDGPHS